MSANDISSSCELENLKRNGGHDELSDENGHVNSEGQLATRAMIGQKLDEAAALGSFGELRIKIQKGRIIQFSFEQSTLAVD